MGRIFFSIEKKIKNWGEVVGNFTRGRVEYLQKSHSLSPFRKLPYPAVNIFISDYRQKYNDAAKDCKPKDGRDEVVEN